MRPVRGDYPCKVCGEVLHSPGALGGHMSQHRRLGHMDWWEHVTEQGERAILPPVIPQTETSSR